MKWATHRMSNINLKKEENKPINSLYFCAKDKDGKSVLIEVNGSKIYSINIEGDKNEIN